MLNVWPLDERPEVMFILMHLQYKLIGTNWRRSNVPGSGVGQRRWTKPDYLHQAGGSDIPDPDPIGRDIARIRFTGVLQICTLSQAIIAEWAIKDPDRWTK